MISHNSLASFSVLTQIINDLGCFLSNYELEIDSRKVDSNSIFCAYPGCRDDGRNYIQEVIIKGAKAILYEAGIKLEISVKTIPVKHLIYYIGLLAAYKYNNPSEKYYTIGVTGTNGKTSITHWLNQIYTVLGNKTAIIGTTGAGIYTNIIDYASTTPDPITLQKLLDSFATEQIDLLALEVSSHALHQGRVNGIAFKTAIFANLSQDHLDYHKTMEEYYKAKRELFYWHGLEHAIINVDDKYGRRLTDELAKDIVNNGSLLKVLTYGIDNGDLRASDLLITLAGMSFKVKYNDEEYPVRVNIIGRFNVYNILAVVASLIVRGYKLAVITPLLSSLKSVRGRMDTIIENNQPLIVIDYAHTPDALFNTLKTLKQIKHSGQLYCVFGCGGNRDAAKRPMMGNIATTLADFTYITSDNPRYEDPKFINRQIVANCANSNYSIIINRKNAITKAVSMAKAGDIILIAGKGHETYQDIKGEKTYFSDFEVAKLALKLG